MANLETNYLGLQLKNPLIVSSSGLTDNVAKVCKLEEQGAGAVVLKSLFEEQINHETGNLLGSTDYNFPEVEDYVAYYTRQNAVDNYLNLIKDCKNSVSIPIIASINCTSNGGWVEFAKKIQDAGADALEVNAFLISTEIDQNSQEVEGKYLELAESINNTVKLPISFKISSQFTSLPYIINELKNRGVKGVVLFNRFYEPDIDIFDLKFKSSDIYSKSGDISKSIRWTGIVSSLIKNIDIASSTGVYNGSDAVKMILSGASAVQICSTLYKNGGMQLQTILKEMQQWMDKLNYRQINEFKGLMNYKNLNGSVAYERSQFIKYFAGVS